MANNAKEVKRRVEELQQPTLSQGAASQGAAAMDTSSTPVRNANNGSNAVNNAAQNGSSHSHQSESSHSHQNGSSNQNGSTPNGSTQAALVNGSTQPQPGQFGSFEASTAPSPIYFAGNPLNKAKATWGQPQCSFSQIFKFLTGKDTEPCGRAERPAEACDCCQRIPAFYLRREWCREVPASDVPNLGLLANQSFILPNGCRLVVYTSDKEAQASPWANAPYVHGSQYIYSNQQGQQAICFHVCRTCRRCEIKPLAGNDATLYCKKGDANKPASLAKSSDHAEKRPLDSSIRSSRGYGRPDPCRFVFNESTFPMHVRLPAGVLARKDVTGQMSYLGTNDIVCFFDDVLMPFEIENNVVIIEVHRNPFEKLYRPKEYDNLGITVAVYRKGGRVPTPGLNLTGGRRFASANGGGGGDKNSNAMETKSDGKAQSEKQSTSVKGPVEGSAQGDIIYKSTLRFYMRSPETGDGASDSDSDEDEQAIPKGVVAKRRYHMAEHLQLAMTFRGQESFYTVIQGYLRGGFFEGTLQERANEKSKRNSLFTEVMKLDVAAARKYVSEMLVEVGLYYLKHCKGEQDFRDGALQLLDFAHSLGAVGLKPFQTILKEGPFITSNNKSKCFRFPRKFGNEVRNVLVTAQPNGDITEIIEGDPSSSNASRWAGNSLDELLYANFDVNAFAKMSLSDDPTATAMDKDQLEEARAATFFPPTGLPQPILLSGGPASVNGSQDLKDKKDAADPEVNPSMPKIAPTTLKSLPEQLEVFNSAVGLSNILCLYDKDTAKLVLDAVQGAVWQSGYMAPTNAKGQPVSDLTKSYWQAGLKWACTLWPHDLTKGVYQQGLDETQFINIMGKWLNSKAYMEFELMYPSRIRVSHLRKLFRLYTNNLAPNSQFDPTKPMTPMGIVHFVQCALLFLTPNGLLRADHKVLNLHAPLALPCAIDCIYDALTEPNTEKWLTLFRGAVSRPAGEAAWRQYKATEKPDEEVPFFLRLPEVRVENNIAYGLNMLQCFEKKGEFEHRILAVDVFNEQNVCRSRLLDAHGKEQNHLGNWLLGFLTGAPTDTHNSSGGGHKRRYVPRRKRYRGNGAPDSSE